VHRWVLSRDRRPLAGRHGGEIGSDRYSKMGRKGGEGGGTISPWEPGYPGNHLRSGVSGELMCGFESLRGGDVCRVGGRQNQPATLIRALFAPDSRLGLGYQVASSRRRKSIRIKEAKSDLSLELPQD